MRENLEMLFTQLWDQYTLQNPSAQKIHDLFTSLGEKVNNDHIAFRTVNDPRYNIDRLAAPFEQLGYVKAGEYHFSKKHLFARHYELPGDPGSPRIFISELKLEEMNRETNIIFKKLLDSGTPDPNVPLVFQGNIFGNPSYEVYNKMITDSEYAGWFYVHGLRVNHFTVSINALQTYNSIEKVNRLLKENGYALNRSGGEIKGTPEVFLQQSSTLADRVPVDFSEGRFEVPACYYEFALRYPDASGKLFGGFIADSADKIFESTDAHPQKNK